MGGVPWSSGGPPDRQVGEGPGHHGGVFLGEDLLTWLVLATGAALAVGNIAALVRPPARRDEGDLDRAPVVRSVVMALVGAVAAIWAAATLLTS